MAATIKLDYFTRITEIHFGVRPWYYFLPTQHTLQLFRDQGVWGISTSASYVNIGIFIHGPGPELPPIGWDSLEAAVEGGDAETDYFYLDPRELPPERLQPPHDQGGETPFDLPNIWEITGLQQKFTADKQGKVIGATPTTAEYKTLVQTFESMWNSTSAKYDAEFAVNIGSGEARLITVPWPPAFDFAVPLGDPSDLRHTPFAFTGGIPAAWNLFGGQSIFQPCHATTIKVDQLDPQKWDTSNPLQPVPR